MTNEELLKPRYIVINDYPNSIFDIGEILDEEYVGKSSFNELKNFPHLFKPLEWWEERNIQDLPKYLKSKYEDGKFDFYKVEKYFYKYSDLRFEWIDDESSETFKELLKYSGCLPSTEEEYLEYIKTLEK